MKPILTLIVLFITTFSYSKSIVWAAKGEPKINDSIALIQNQINSHDIIKLNSENDYLCIYDDKAHKIVELQGIQSINYTDLMTLFKAVSRLPEFTIPMPLIRKGYYQLGSVSRRPPTQQIFPIHLKISIGIDDTLSFKVIPSPLDNTFFYDFEISDFYGEVNYTQKLTSNDHVSIKIPVKEFAEITTEFLITDSSTVSSHLTNNNLSASNNYQTINVMSNLHLNNHRNIINELLSKNTIAYTTCAILYALENNLVFDALKISQTNSDLGLMYDGLNLSYQKWKFTLEGDVKFRKHY